MLPISHSDFSYLSDMKTADRDMLYHSLKKRGGFWSYAHQPDVPDELLIEECLRRGDVPDLKVLFSLFPRKEIAAVWKKNLLPDERLYRHNFYLACIFFNIKNPKRYIQPYLNYAGRQQRIQELIA
jgi:hypothetical protein